MQVFTTILLIALGICVDAMYNSIRRNAEKQAYEIGYRQASREEQDRHYAVKAYAEGTSVYAIKQMAGDQPHRKPYVVSNDFVERMQANGRATELVR